MLKGFRIKSFKNIVRHSYSLRKENIKRKLIMKV